MKLVSKWIVLVALAFYVAGCAGKKELRRLENSYQEQLQEYGQQLQASELTKAEHDSKVALLNSRYGNRRREFEEGRDGQGGANDRFNERFYDRDQRERNSIQRRLRGDDE